MTADEELIDLFLDYLRYERGRSPQTVKRYSTALLKFYSFIKEEDQTQTWATADVDLIRLWLADQMEHGNIATTVNTDLSALKSFYRFALARGLLQRDPARAVRGPKKKRPLPQYMREGEMDRLIDSEEWDTEAYDDVLARTIIILLYTTGLRRSEALGLDDKSIDWTASQLRVTGKRNKQRLVPFGDELAETLRQYIAMRDRCVPRQTDALLCNSKGLRLKGAQLYSIVRSQLSRVTTMSKRSPHVLRHSFATALLNHGADLESVRQLLGHSSVAATEIYTHTTFEQLRREYENAHPRENT